MANEYATGTIAAGLFLFSGVLAWHLVLLAYSLVKRVDKALSPQSFFNYTVILFAVFRISHVAMANAGGWAPFYTNRLALLLFMTALSITLYTWIAALGIVLAADAGLVSEVRGMLEKLQWIFLGVNVAVYIVVIITIAMYATTNADSWYNAGIILMAVIILLMACLFLIQAFRLYSQAEKSSAHVHKVLLRAAICSLVVSLAFLLRVIMLLYRPISGKYINDDAFFILTYEVPELIPLFVSLVVHTFRVTSAGDAESEYQQVGTDSGRDHHHRGPSGGIGGGGVGPRGNTISQQQNGNGPSSSVRGVAGSSVGHRGGTGYSTDGETLPDYDMPPDDHQL